MDYDPTCKLSGCFEERPGYIQFNVNLMDRGKEGSSTVSRKDDPHHMMNWIQSNYLEEKEEEFKL